MLGLRQADARSSECCGSLHGPALQETSQRSCMRCSSAPTAPAAGGSALPGGALPPSPAHSFSRAWVELTVPSTKKTWVPQSGGNGPAHIEECRRLFWVAARLAAACHTTQQLCTHAWSHPAAQKPPQLHL